MKAGSWLKNEHHQQLLERWWILIVLLWDIAKTLIIDKAFAKYGISPYIYFVIVIVIAIPYALSTAKMLFSIINNHWRHAALFGAIAALLHFIPDIYILVNAKEVPRSLFDSFIVAAVIFTIFAVHGILSQVRAHKSK
jgi:hypothetical protein